MVAVRGGRVGLLLLLLRGGRWRRCRLLLALEGEIKRGYDFQL